MRADERALRIQAARREYLDILSRTGLNWKAKIAKYYDVSECEMDQ